MHQRVSALLHLAWALDPKIGSVAVCSMTGVTFAGTLGSKGFLINQNLRPWLCFVPHPCVRALVPLVQSVCYPEPLVSPAKLPRLQWPWHHRRR